MDEIREHEIIKRTVRIKRHAARIKFDLQAKNNDFEGACGQALTHVMFRMPAIKDYSLFYRLLSFHYTSTSSSIPQMAYFGLKIAPITVLPAEETALPPMS
ncbi:hypothetical protein VCUG_00163 [Vavraia culicis subsp. floridensis]|uniref:Uncharacterized protein n=1 Tax=Vavraia culicis (isolate floridensis) TaxID=948595 RepID=L2GYA4_VAVCU|nr:uncharacterized protein VCUG_00163 [Vavraia culicis subsp. floridensis]ELA48327.1 hypothetical protein VCUG_00163 [Vavraia culicis subsp. floridensis]